MSDISLWRFWKERSSSQSQGASCSVDFNDFSHSLVMETSSPPSASTTPNYPNMQNSTQEPMMLFPVHHSKRMPDPEDAWWIRHGLPFPPPPPPTTQNHEMEFWADDASRSPIEGASLKWNVDDDFQCPVKQSDSTSPNPGLERREESGGAFGKSINLWFPLLLLSLGINFCLSLASRISKMRRHLKSLFKPKSKGSPQVEMFRNSVGYRSLPPSHRVAYAQKTVDCFERTAHWVLDQAELRDR